MSIKRNSHIALVAAALLSLSFTSGFADTGNTNKSDENGGRGKIEYPLFGGAPKGLPGFSTYASTHPAGTTKATLKNQYGIQYHGGAVMNDANGVNVYIVWYGDWGSDTAKTILPTFLSNLNNSAYFGINSTYTDANGVAITPKVNVLGQYSYASTTLGTTLTDANVLALAKGALGQNGIPSTIDPNALYFVLTSKEIGESSGFLSAYCGWHSSEVMDAGATGPVPATNMKYSFVGNPGTNTGCIGQAITASPNNNYDADAMASVIAHELEETVTDPDGNAWWTTANGQENGDKCAWNFGRTSTLPGSTATYTGSVTAAKSNGTVTANVTAASNNSALSTVAISKITNNSTTGAGGSTITFTTATNSFAVGDLITIPSTPALPAPYSALVVNNASITARSSTSITIQSPTVVNTPKNTSVSGVSATGSRAGTTITYTASNTFAVGQSVTVTGATAPYNVTSQPITARSSTSFTISVPTTAGTAALAKGTYAASVSGAGTQIVYTYTPTVGQTFAVGDKVTVAASQAGYSVTNASITAATSTTFTVAATVPANTPAPTFPITASASHTLPGAIYNLTLNSSKYLIQQNWANRSPNGICALS